MTTWEGEAPAEPPAGKGSAGASPSRSLWESLNWLNRNRPLRRF